MLERGNRSQTQQEKKNSNLTTTTTTTAPKACKNTSPNCDLTLATKRLKKQLKPKKTGKLDIPIDSMSLQGHRNLDQENRAPEMEMSAFCDSPDELARVEILDTLTSSAQESDNDSVAGTTGVTMAVYKNNNKQQLSWRQNKRKQSRPQRCSTYLRDRNHSLDSPLDLSDFHKDSDEEDCYDHISMATNATSQQPAPSQNGCHKVTNGNGLATDLEVDFEPGDPDPQLDSEVENVNGKDYTLGGLRNKYHLHPQHPTSGLPCVFTIQPNAASLDSDVDSPSQSELDSYVMAENEISSLERGENENGSRGSDAEASTVSDALMENVINIEPMNTESAADAATKEQEDLEPGEVLNLRTPRGLGSGGGGMSSLLTHPASGLHIPELAASLGKAAHHSSRDHRGGGDARQTAPLVGRTPLRHRRTIGELYGLMNPQRRGGNNRGGATNHIAMKYRRDCPIPGCGARYLTNLCDHLKKTHGLGPEERRPWLEKAKRIHQQKQLQEQQQHMQSSSPVLVTANNVKSSPLSGSNPTPAHTHHARNGNNNPSPTSSSSPGNISQQQQAAAAAAANLAASPALAAIALATSQSTASLSSTADSLAMAMSQIPLNSAALLMQQAQALSLLNAAQAFPASHVTPTAAFPGFSAALSQPRSAGASSSFPFSSLASSGSSVVGNGSGTRVRAPWNSSGSRKNCPVPGCGAKSLLNLSDHLSKVHSMTRDERQPWLQRARDELA